MGSSKLAPGASDEFSTAEVHEILLGVLGSRELLKSEISEPSTEALAGGCSAE